MAVLALLAGAAAAQPVGSPLPPSRNPGTTHHPPVEDALFPGLSGDLARLEAEGWAIHGQSTFVLQGHQRIRSPYRGAGSLRPGDEFRNTFSSDILIGRRLWQGAEVYVDASVTRGFGVSNTVGIAAYPSNEAFKRGTEQPYFYVPRILFRQTIPLGGEMVPAEDDPLRFNTPLPQERVTFTIGRMSVWDIFDSNRYAHDARTQFMNWALVGAGAVDWTADTRGWTNGAALEVEDGEWAAKIGAFQVANRVNGLSLDTAVTRAWQVLAELEHAHEINGHPGAVRVLYAASRGRFSTWTELLANGFETIARNPAGYRVKHMAAVNAEQQITPELGAFARLSWNDGRTQSWAFTDMDRAVSAGLSLKGARWGRAEDTIGLGGNIGWISGGRRQFLEAGGVGIITGDGRLNYRPEKAMEMYYDARLAPGVHAALNYQLAVNPAYNADRGPVHLVAMRVRTAF